MNRDHAISRKLQGAIFAHLQEERAILERLKQAAIDVTECGFRSSLLIDRQSKLIAVQEELQHLGKQRELVRIAIARVTGVPSSEVRISHLQFQTLDETAALNAECSRLASLTADVQANLEIATRSLRSWSTVVGYMFGELMETSVTSQRYSANGLRVSNMGSGHIEMRS
ncbi:hypothetical protein SH668x_000893 [Planctomicrobium sp. SH668]|uniref:hypothetical protein n=1 Tax=Planctomicrobium sp. SH668 TaxID=3448126 RepID=UPI003F5BB0B8